MNEQERLHLEEVLLLLQRPAKRFIQRARKMLEHLLDAEPDKNCVTLPDGSCISSDCMHNTPGSLD